VDVGVSYLELHGFPINGGHTDVQKPIVAGAFGFQWDYPLVLFLVPILAMWDGVRWLLVLRLSWCLSKGSSLPGDQRSVDNPNGRLECPSCLRYLHYFLNEKNGVSIIEVFHGIDTILLRTPFPFYN